MKHNIFLVLTVFALTGCKSNPNKAEDVQSNLDQAAKVSGQEKVGLKNGEMVVLNKVEMAEKLRDLQNSVYSLEDRVYGTRKLGSLGLYGDLKSCKRKIASRQYGGSGSLMWTEPLDRVTDKEQDLKIGVDEKKDLVGLNEEFLKDRIQRFQGYKTILQKRADEFEEKIEACNGELSTKKMDATQPSKILVSEVPKAVTDRASVNEFMCGFVREGASLESFMINAFARGWLSLSDFKLEQNLLAGPVKDAKGDPRDNAFLFNGWKMAFDRSPVTVGELLNEGKDAKLMAWSYDKKGDVTNSSRCLSANDGQWNH